MLEVKRVFLCQKPSMYLSNTNFENTHLLKNFRYQRTRFHKLKLSSDIFDELKPFDLSEVITSNFN